jgi:hypothetical protein
MVVWYWRLKIVCGDWCDNDLVLLINEKMFMVEGCYYSYEVLWCCSLWLWSDDCEWKSWLVLMNSEEVWLKKKGRCPCVAMLLFLSFFFVHEFPSFVCKTFDSYNIRVFSPYSHFRRHLTELNLDLWMKWENSLLCWFALQCVIISLFHYLTFFKLMKIFFCCFYNFWTKVKKIK